MVLAAPLLFEGGQAREEELLAELIEVVHHDFLAICRVRFDGDPGGSLELSRGNAVILLEESYNRRLRIIEVFHRDHDIGSGLVRHVPDELFHQLVAG